MIIRGLSKGSLWKRYNTTLPSRANPAFTIRAALFVASIFFISPGPAKAGSVIAALNRASLGAAEVLDWGGFGPAFTDVTSGSILPAAGVVVTVSQPLYGMQVRQQDALSASIGGWNGDFLPGQYLLTNWNSPNAITLSFSTPVYGAGLQIEPGQVQDLPAPFTAFVTAFSGDSVLAQFSVQGDRSLGYDDSAPFLGILSTTANITSIRYSVSVQTNGPYTGDLGLNFLSIETAAPAPEPNSQFIALGGIVLGVALFGYRRQGKSTVNRVGVLGNARTIL